MTRRRPRKLTGIVGITLVLFISLRSADAATDACVEAARIAEADTSLPPGLLLAIGTVESGRSDTLGRRLPWPWTMNAGGIGRFFDSAEAAIAAVQGLRASGVQSIDIGCFQINLWHHPNAFADVPSGFDPLVNARAAARFLIALHAELGAWEPAIAAYHSRGDTLGAAYRDRVLAAWHGVPAPPAMVFAGVHVWGPEGQIGIGASPSAPPQLFTMARASAPRLPRVITASIR